MTTLQNLTRILDEHTQLIAPQELEQFLDKPFFCPWTFGRKLTTTQCCFNHMIFMPVKNGVTHELYDYEKDIIDYLERDEPTDPKNKHLHILKSAGLGATTLLLRYIAWKCTTNKI